jgi:hypothetical protein
MPQASEANNQAARLRRLPPLAMGPLTTTRCTKTVNLVLNKDAEPGALRPGRQLSISDDEIARQAHKCWQAMILSILLVHDADMHTRLISNAAGFLG